MITTSPATVFILRPRVQSKSHGYIVLHFSLALLLPAVVAGALAFRRMPVEYFAIMNFGVLLFAIIGSIYLPLIALRTDGYRLSTKRDWQQREQP